MVKLGSNFKNVNLQIQSSLVKNNTLYKQWFREAILKPVIAQTC